MVRSLETSGGGWEKDQHKSHRNAKYHILEEAFKCVTCGLKVERDEQKTGQIFTSYDDLLSHRIRILEL